MGEVFENDSEYIKDDETSGEAGSGVESDLPVTSDPDLPPAVTSGPAQIIGDIVLITPDGPIIMYADSGGEEYDAIVSRATEHWVNNYGAMDKSYHTYTPSEAYLFIIAVGTVVGLLFKIFKRRKL